MSEYVNWLTELSEGVDAIIFESHVEHEKAVESWLNLVKENLQAIVNDSPTDSSCAGGSTYKDLPSCVSLVKSRTEIKSDEKRERVSRLLSGMQKGRLHLKRPSTRLDKSSKELCDKSVGSGERETPTKGSSKEFSFKTLNKTHIFSTPIKQAQLQKIASINQDKKEQISATPRRRTNSISPTDSQQEKTKRKSSKELSNHTKKAKVNTSSFATQKNQVLLQQTAKTLELDTRERREREKKTEVSGASTTTKVEGRILRVRNIQKKPIVLQNENLRKVVALREREKEENKKKREEKSKNSQIQRLKLEKEREERIRERTRAAHVEKTDSMHRVPVQNSERIPSKAGLKRNIASPVNKPLPAKKADVCDIKTVPAKTTSVSTHDMNRTYCTRSSNSEKPNPTVKAIPHTPPKQPESKVTAAPASTSHTLKSESYVMTPGTTSFVSYDISEINSDDSDEEETNNNKPIPAWASGVRLRNALLQQHYHPVDIERLFGNDVSPPDLEVIMGVKKNCYNKRTSSAIWNTTFT